MQVIATAVGFDGTDIRQVGEEFSMPEGAKGSWFKPVEEPVKPAKASKSEGKGEKADSLV